MAIYQSTTMVTGPLLSRASSLPQVFAVFRPLLHAVQCDAGYGSSATYPHTFSPLPDLYARNARRRTSGALRRHGSGAGSGTPRTPALRFPVEPASGR